MKQKSENLQGIKGADAIASRVFPSSTVNDGRTNSKTGTRLTQPCSRPVLYELVDKEGRVHVETFDSAASAVQCARQIYPDQHRDEERKGLGWDIRVVGAQ